MSYWRCYPEIRRTTYIVEHLSDDSYVETLLLRLLPEHLLVGVPKLAGPCIGASELYIFVNDNLVRIENLWTAI
jgi:hypothetical protein